MLNLLGAPLEVALGAFPGFEDRLEAAPSLASAPVFAAGAFAGAGFLAGALTGATVFPAAAFAGAGFLVAAFVGAALLAVMVFLGFSLGIFFPLFVGAAGAIQVLQVAFAHVLVVVAEFLKRHRLDRSGPGAAC